MKLSKKTILVMTFALLLSAFSTGMAQTPTQGDQKKAEACCCCSDSCDMKDMKHDMKDMKDMKDHKGDCCKAKSKDAKSKDKK